MGSSVLVIATLVLAVVGSSCGNGVPRDLSFITALIEPYATVCIPGKLSCSADCQTIQFCLGGSLEDVKKCPPETKCDSTTNTCKPDAEAECGTINPDVFACRGPVGGRFPNPYDCHSYFECTDPPLTTTAAPTTPTTVTTAPPTPPPAHEETLPQYRLDHTPRSLENGSKHICPDTTAYDAFSTTCRFKETHRVCKEGPVPACKAQFQAGPLIENPNIYYVCVSVNGVLQPWLAKCLDPASIFENGQCVETLKI